jgi:subtilase family serine protease
MMSFAPRSGWSACLLAGAVAASTAFVCGMAVAADPQHAHVRLHGAIDDNDRITFSGNRHVRLDKAEDRGPAADSLMVHRMILTLQPDAEQQHALDEFMASRRDPTSPFYGQWLSPAEFEKQFGVAEADVNTVKQWLQAQGFTIDEVPQGRRSIVFSGAVRHIRKAFRTDMRHYRIGQEDHIANATDPSIPDALSAVVSGVVSLHDFRSRPMLSSVRPAPAYTSGNSHALAAADFATIYNTQTLLAQGNDGTGSTIAVLGRTDVVLGDMAQFRSTMGLSNNPPQIIYNGTNPGRQTGDEGESDLDLQWAGAVAPGATIKFVTSASTGSTDGIDLSAQYAVSNNVADIITLSYGLCEADLGASSVNFYNNLWQQAAAQGQSVFVSSGDHHGHAWESGQRAVHVAIFNLRRRHPV